MANVNTPQGFIPQFHINGSLWNGQTTMYAVKGTGSNSAIYPGDAVMLDATNRVTADGKFQYVIVGAATSALRGVCVGVVPVPPSNLGVTMGAPNLDIKYVPANSSVDYYILVCDDPTVLYETQEIGASTLTTATGPGRNFNLKTGTPSTTAQNSAQGIDNTTSATTATLPFKCMRLSPRPDNAIGAYAKWLVMINNHDLSAGTGTAGI